MTTQTAFNPVQFKTATRTQWENAASAWDRWGSIIGQWLGPATHRMLDLTSVEPGSRILDVAAGAGEQTLQAARRAGPTGYVLATDISPAILGYAETAARKAGLTNIDIRELDGESLAELPAEGFDVVISRVGLIYFPDQQKALEGMKHALKVGGHIGAIVYSTAQNNPFFSIPISIIRRRAKLPPPLQGQPGPFSLGTEDVLADSFKRAGFRKIEVESISAPLRLPSPADCVRFERESFGALHQMMMTLTKTEQNDTWLEIEHELSQFNGPDGFIGPCEMLVAKGVK